MRRSRTHRWGRSARARILDQYIRTNFRDFTLVGLTAQGCDYEDPDSVAEIELDDIHRIKIVSDEQHCDITRLFA